MGSGSSTPRASYLGEQKKSARYLAKRPNQIETKNSNGVEEEDEDRPHIEPIPGGDQETALLYARAKLILQEMWLAEVADKCNIPQHKDSISPKKRSVSSQSAGRSPVGRNNSLKSPFSPSPVSPFARSPSQSNAAVAKIQLVKSLKMSPPFALLATPSAIVLHWKAEGRGPNDFQSVDGYNVQWIIEPDEYDEAFLLEGDTSHLKLRSSKASAVKEISGWSAPGSIRSGLTPLHYQASNRDWADVPRRCIRSFDKMVIIQGLDPQCSSLRFRVRASKNSISGPFSGPSHCVSTAPTVRQGAPRLQNSSTAASPLGVDVSWDPLRHYIDGMDAVYYLFAKNTAEKSSKHEDDPFQTMDLLYTGRHCKFTAGGEGEESLKGNTVYQMRVSACWADLDGSEHYVHSAITEIKTNVAPPPSAPRPVTFSESMSGSDVRLQISWTVPPGEGYAYSSAGGLTYHLYGSCPANDALRKSVFESRDTKRLSGTYALYYSGSQTSIFLGDANDANASILASAPVIPGSSYSFLICASNEFGKGDYSSISNFTVSSASAQSASSAVGAPLDESTSMRTVCALNESWSEVWTRNAPPYYFNTITLETQWEHPFKDEDRDFLFRQKRFAFLFKLWKMSEDVESDEEVLRMQLRRTHAFYDSFRCFKRFTPLQLVKGKLRISYFGEDGIDSGGITKDWFIDMSKQFGNPDICLLSYVGDTQKLWFDKNSNVNSEHLEYFHFLGRVIGKAIHDRHVLGLPLCNVIYKHILGMELKLDDLEAFDKVKYKSLNWMLSNDITGVFDETFTVLVDRFGSKKEIELIPGGARVEVTEENKAKYVALVVKWELGGSEQLKAVLDGVYDIIPLFAKGDVYIERI